MTIYQNIDHVRKIISEAEALYNRPADSVLLLAVSKQQQAADIKTAFQHGIGDFGENYFQEAIEKINTLNELPINWHFIGSIQSNKAKDIAENFSWVHTVDRLKIAQLLNKNRPAGMIPLKICLQINLAAETSKSGITAEEASALALAVSKLPNLKLKGLMTIPPLQQNEQTQYELLLKLNNLMHRLNKELGLRMDTLSMGMSDDLTAAIRAGATMVRIGRAIFGKRTTKEQ